MTFWPWNCCALLPVGWTTFLPILLFLGRFVLDLTANTCQARHVTLRPWPLILEVMALIADAGLCASSVYQVWVSYAFSFGRYWTFTTCRPRIILHCIVLLYICFIFFLLFMFISSCSLTAKHNKRIYNIFTVWALVGLVYLTFDLLISKSVYWLPVWWAFIRPDLGFLRLSVLELCRGTRQTDGRTDRHRRSIYNAPPFGRGHNKCATRCRELLR